MPAPAPRLVAGRPRPKASARALSAVIGLDGAAALDADGRLVWSTSRGRSVKLPLEARPGPCELQPSGEDLTVIQGGRLRQYSWPDLDEDEVPYSILAPDGLDGRRGRLLVLHRDGRWTLDLPGKGRTQAQGRLPAPLRPQAIWLAPTGLAAAVADSRGGLGMLLLPRGEWTPLPTPPTPLQALAWAPDGQRFVTVDAAGRVQVFNRAGKAAGPAWTLTGGPVDGLLWPTHDEIRIAVGGRLVVWDRAEDRRADRSLPPGAEGVKPCSKGSLVALPGGELAWVDPDGAPIWRAQPGLGRLSGLACDLDGPQVAAWTKDGRLALLDADTGRLRLRTPALGPLRRPVRRRDGHLLAVGDAGRTVDLWLGVLTAAPDGLAARLGSARGLYAQPEGVFLGPPWPSPPALR